MALLAPRCHVLRDGDRIVGDLCSQFALNMSSGGAFSTLSVTELYSLIEEARLSIGHRYSIQISQFVRDAGGRQSRVARVLPCVPSAATHTRKQFAQLRRALGGKTASRQSCDDGQTEHRRNLNCSIDPRLEWGLHTSPTVDKVEASYPLLQILQGHQMRALGEPFYTDT